MIQSMDARSSSCALLALVLASCGGAPPLRDAAPPGATEVRCVNATSGTAWSLRLDDARKLADGQPARMGASRVDWRDPSGQARYHLDRRSGALTVTRASSTGGYMIVYRCAAPVRGAG
jgi:hypothetical protein